MPSSHGLKARHETWFRGEEARVCKVSYGCERLMDEIRMLREEVCRLRGGCKRRWRVKITGQAVGDVSSGFKFQNSIVCEERWRVFLFEYIYTHTRSPARWLEMLVQDPNFQTPHL